MLDASIRVRQTYRDMLDHRDGFEMLPSAVKDYSDLTVHVWQSAGSKDAFARNGEVIVKAVAATIMTKPDETWLVITHKRSSKVPDVERQVRAALPKQGGPQVAFLTFGSHMATNDHSEVQNVILAGQFFTPMAHTVALTHAAQGRPFASGMASSAEIEATRRGELADVTLQAIARGRCRKSVGPKAAAMDAYIIATVQSGVPGALKDIFPGCQLKAWEPVRKVLRGNVLRAIIHLREAFTAGAVSVAYKAIYRALAMTSGNFCKEVSQTDEWRRAVASEGWEIRRGARRVLSVSPVGG